MAKPKSSIIYSGASLIDGMHIIAVAIISSNNSKTGNMVQTHILRADMDPMKASKTGADQSICGDCTHRGTPTENALKSTAKGRTCYVNLGQGPNQVYKAYKAGKYPVADNQDIINIGDNRMIRLGTYGDPAAIPAEVWDKLLLKSKGHTGYTHQHNADNTPDYSRLMYSADNKQNAIIAHNKGYRTFRVIPVKEYTDKGINSLLDNEILCPASKEQEYKTTCINCKLCTGNTIKAKSIAIVAHGTAKNKFIG